MRIIDVRDGHVKKDVAKGRTVLEAEIGHPAKVVMVIRGAGPEIGQFADRASGRSEGFNFREVVWVKDTRVFKANQEDDLFEGHGEAVAVILDLDDRPAVWLEADDRTLAIERAFLAAQAATS